MTTPTPAQDAQPVLANSNAERMARIRADIADIRERIRTGDVSDIDPEHLALASRARKGEPDNERTAIKQLVAGMAFVGQITDTEQLVDITLDAWNRRASPATPAGVVQALEDALRDLADCGAEAWGEDRPCVRVARAALASLPQPAVVEVSLPELPDQYEGAAHMYPLDLLDFRKQEMTGTAFSIPVGSPDFGKSEPLFTMAFIRARDASILAAVSKAMGVEVKGKAT